MYNNLNKGKKRKVIKMNESKIFLWEKQNIPLYDTADEKLMPSMRAYIKDGAKACVVICPGGGYGMKAYHEGEPIAWWLNSIGISAFVLDYRVNPYKFPAPMLDAQRAVRYARYLSKDYGYDKDKIGILGFSAGGHLAAYCGTIFDDLRYCAQDEIDKMSSRPDFMVLCYPVISLVSCFHYGSRVNLLGDVDYQTASKYSIERRVTKDTSPAFIWHTATDDMPVENSLMLAGELSKKNVPFELHIFREGPHGLGLAETKKDIREWVNLCERWFKGMGIIHDCNCETCASKDVCENKNICPDK